MTAPSGMPEPFDAWDDAPDPAQSAVDGQPATRVGDAAGFMLGVADVLAQIAEEAEPIRAGRWRALVMHGDAPAPVGWDPPQWDYDAIEAWIPQALQAGTLTPLPKATAEKVPEPELVFGSTAEWVAEFLVPMYRRQLTATGDRTTWCPQWWRHAEAIIRLEALWRAWEHLRLDGRTGASVWLKDHLDHHLPVLLDAHDGPFNGCRPDRHADDPLGEFQLVAPPPEWFPDVRKTRTDNSEGGRRP
ncbi:DUF4913 domain-containing protein [Sinomonas albida]|uniref:DUF4913 domain-containing protein n=1 Tax=Sinomonas albida TaxID=369942 RepID=UPI003015F28F